MFLTGIIITDGVSPHLPLVLEKLSRATDEVVVVSNEADELVEELARRHDNARWFHHDLVSFADQRMWAQGRARPGWVVHIDSDEVPSSDLLIAFDDLRKTDAARANAYAIRRHTIAWGRWLRHGGMYPDEKVRVMPSNTQWVGQVHEVPLCDGIVERLPGYVDHFSAEDLVVDWFRKAPVYMKLDMRQRRKRILPLPLLLVAKPLWVLGKNVIGRAAWRDGVPGIVAQLTGACYEALLYASLWNEEAERRTRGAGNGS